MKLNLLFVMLNDGRSFITDSLHLNHDNRLEGSDLQNGGKIIISGEEINAIEPSTYIRDYHNGVCPECGFAGL